VLLARIKTVLRRTERPEWVPPVEVEPLVVGDLVIDSAAHIVTLKSEPVDLPRLEFDLLYSLALEAGHVLSVDDLLSRVWGAEYLGEPQVVYVHIRWLREKLEEDPHHPRRIVTVRGVGYKLEPQEEEV
jgi:DNA-binding response OmpR family regulator